MLKVTQFDFVDIGASIGEICCHCGCVVDGSSDVRKSALLSLIKKAREEQPEVWDEYFNAVLLILLETVTDDDVNFITNMLIFI